MANFPKLWDSANSDFEAGVFQANPFSLYIKNLELVMSQTGDYKSVTPKNMKIYGAHLRSLTSFSHENPNMVSNGTFLKTIILLPYLKKLGVNTLYLLPISKPSWHILKGSLPSPYAGTSFYRLDPILNDSLLEDEFSLDEQFGALVEACHNMGIKVVMDFVFRTVGRDHEWVFEHPDWFVWIEKSKEAEFRAPSVEGLSKESPTELISKQIELEDIPVMFKNESVKEYLKYFKELPKEALKKFQTKEIYDLKNVEAQYDLTTVPAFSDWFNDPQPPWTDITYLRFYLDQPTPSKKYLNKNQSPYMLYDVIHSDRIEGEIVNKELWDRLSNVIPYFEEKFGIDGARIDMAHSMPKDLMNSILSRAKEKNKDFIFISEDFDMNPLVVENKKKHFNIFLGNLAFFEQPEQLHQLRGLAYEQISNISIPLMASSETADTSRTASRHADYVMYSRSMYILNSFMPNSVFFINGGFELLEKVSLNGALAAATNNEEAGKAPVAFFNHSEMSWDNEEAQHFLHFIKTINTFRDETGAVREFVDNDIEGLIIIKTMKNYVFANLSTEVIGLKELSNKKISIRQSSYNNKPETELRPLEVIIATL